jgi:cell division GTPase FtsZ
MVGRNNLFKQFKRPSFQAQVVEKAKEISQIKEEVPVHKELFIGKTGEQKPQKNTGKPRKNTKTTRKKKKTANDIHKEIKSLVEAGNVKKARSVLKKALKDGYGGKRLASWSTRLPMLEKEMGSNLRKMWKKQDLRKINAAGTVDTRPKDGLEKYVDEREKKEPGFKELVKKEKEDVLAEIEKNYPADMGIAPADPPENVDPELRKKFNEAMDKLDELTEESQKLGLYGETPLRKQDNQSIITETNKEKTIMELPDLPLEELEEAAETEQEDLSVQDESGGSVVFGILGAGQAGGRIAESFYNLGYKKVLAINTAEHDLSTLTVIPENQKILMSTGKRGGAGKDMRLGEEAADKHQQEIYERMQKVFGDVDRILVCAGGGGGTGGGSCLRLVETAKKYLTYLGGGNVNRRVGVLLTLPRAGEAASPEVADNAHLVATKLNGLAHSGGLGHLIIFDNNKIEKMYPKLTVKQFWPTVNATVTGLFHMFNVLSSKPGSPTSFDPADYQRVLSGGGCMIMGFTSLKQYADGTDISKAIRGNLEKGLLCGGFDISTASTAA